MMYGYNMMVGWPSMWGAWGWGMISLLAIWSLAWKGVALWRAARNEHLPWVIALLIINTAGILEIIYILAFSNAKGKKK